MKEMLIEKEVSRRFCCASVVCAVPCTGRKWSYLEGHSCEQRDTERYAPPSPFHPPSVHTRTPTITQHSIRRDKSRAITGEDFTHYPVKYRYLSSPSITPTAGTSSGWSTIRCFDASTSNTRDPWPISLANSLAANQTVASESCGGVWLL